MDNNIIKLKCPHCQTLLAVRKPETAQGISITCRECKNQIRIKIQQKPIRLPEQGCTRAAAIARLVINEGPQTHKCEFSLHAGSNIIGRLDDDTEQDIAIDGDMTISRRSVNLMVVGNADEGFSYLFKVIKTSNVVYVNGKPMRMGECVDVHPGDIIMLGNTKLMLSV